MTTVLSAGAAIQEYRWLQQCSQERNALKEQLDSYRHTVYVAVEPLAKGTILTGEMVYQEIRYSDALQEEFITEEAFGMALSQDIAEGDCLMADMLFTAEDDVREIFISEVEIPAYIKDGDRSDIRIRYGNAEDYIVLADKILMKCESGTGMVLELTEEEILLLSSAISDKKHYADTKLYAVTYPMYSQTEAGRVSYIANREILTLLGREKTEGESRTALEERLMQKQ